MDIRQYGPALFPTVKQVRRILDENALHRRHDSTQDGPTSGRRDEDPQGLVK